MKKIMSLLIFLICTSTFANTGDLEQKSHTLKIKATDVEALISNDGVYARLDDLREGFEHFDGAYVDQNQVIIDLSDSDLNVGSIVLDNGLEMSPKVVLLDGGDMGGGGKVRR